MPKLYAVKDGPKPDPTPGEGVPLSFDDLVSVFQPYRSRYWSSEPPAFSDAPQTATPVRLVIEVEANEGTHERYPKPGFYVLLDLTPADADALLKKHRIIS